MADPSGRTGQDECGMTTPDSVADPSQSRGAMPGWTDRHEFGELPTAITAPVFVVIAHMVPAAPLLVGTHMLAVRVIATPDGTLLIWLI